MNAIIHAIPLFWKQLINDSEKKCWKNYVAQDHHLIKNTSVIILDKLTAREIYLVLLLSSSNIHQSLKNILAKFFQMKISITRKTIYYQE